MGFASKYNKGTRFNINTEDFEFKTLKDEFEKGNRFHVVRGMFMTKPTKYGSHGVVITNDCFLSLPQHLNDSIQAMLKDDQVEDVCNGSKLGIEIVSYTYVDGEEKTTGYSAVYKDL